MTGHALRKDCTEETNCYHLLWGIKTFYKCLLHCFASYKLAVNLFRMHTNVGCCVVNYVIAYRPVTVVHSL